MLELVTPAEAARELRISLGTVYNFLRDGRVPGIRLGGQWRISRTALDAAAAGELTAATAPPEQVAEPRSSAVGPSRVGRQENPRPPMPTEAVGWDVEQAR
jgi:excisionase family DNA binding protein